MKRTLVIGDIHGGLKALYQVFEKAHVTNEDRLIFLGDYVDGWSESAGVVDYMIQLSSSHNCIFIKGNHDAWTEGWLRNGGTDKIWLFKFSITNSRESLSGSVMHCLIIDSFFTNHCQNSSAFCSSIL